MIIPGKLLLLCNVAFYFLCFALKYSFSEINVAMLLFLLFTIFHFSVLLFTFLIYPFLDFQLINIQYSILFLLLASELYLFLLPLSGCSKINKMHRYVLAYLELLFSKDCTCSCCSFPDSLFQHFTHISHLLIQLMCIMLQHNSICCTPSFAQLLSFISMYTINLILHYFNYQF